MANYFPYDKQVRVPVKRVGDNWEFFYGGGIPIKDGAIAELIVDAAQISDQRFLERITAETTVKVLPEGTELLVALNDKGPRMEEWPAVAVTDVPAGTTRFEVITVAQPPKDAAKQATLKGVEKDTGVWLRLKGLERSELICGAVNLPDGLDRTAASSLNHAYTLLSEKHETHRLSHTGNVYSHIFYKDSDEKWYPLADLRDGVRVAAERTVIEDVWREVEEKLGWRPIAAKRKKRSWR